MKKRIIRLAAILALVSPAALVADDKKETPEKTVEAYDSKTRGAVQVKGETKEWFTVLKGGKVLGQVPRLLNGTEELEPGEYEVQVNKTARTVMVEPGKKVVLLTGTLEVEGEGLYYYPLVGKERKVAANANNPALGRPIALFPGTYAVEVNHKLRKTVRLADEVKVEAGKKTVVKQ